MIRPVLYGYAENERTVGSGAHLKVSLVGRGAWDMIFEGFRRLPLTFLRLFGGRTATKPAGQQSIWAVGTKTGTRLKANMG